MVVPSPERRSSEIGVLGLDSSVHGHVNFQGTLTVDGTVSGDVRSPEGSGAMLIVGQSATIEGDIVSDSVLIGGKVRGNVKARQRVEIFGTGVLHGDIETGDIMIQGGAEFQGRCEMLKPAPLVSGEIEGMPASAQRVESDGAKRARKGKTGRADKVELQAEAGNGTLNGKTAQVAVQQDSRTERGTTTEGPSA